MNTRSRRRIGTAGVFVVHLLALGGLWLSHCEATWLHSPSGGYEVYYWNDVSNPKFRYQNTIGQWGHYSTVGATWYALSGTGLTATFIGDGAWYDLGTGLKYRYDVTNDYGFYMRGSSYRFYYQHLPGQWYTTGYGGGWYALGTANRPAGVVGNGQWHDLGIGLTFRYDVTNDYGFYMRGTLYRFYYRYLQGQWYNSGYGGGWYKIGAAARSAGVLGDGNTYDLGNGLSYRYSATYDFGYYVRGSVYRFYYRYTPGQWYTSGYAGGWYEIGSGERTAAVLGDGGTYDLGTGLSYRYNMSYDFGFYYRGTLYRFYYRYAPGQWYTSGYAGGWHALGSGDRPAGVVGNGQWHDLGIGLKYRYDVTNDYGFYMRGTLYRFYYRYLQGQWYTSGYGGGWYGLGTAGKNATVIVDGGWYDLGNSFRYYYMAEKDWGCFSVGNPEVTPDAVRFRYDYGSGQWCHTGEDFTLGWQPLGASGLSAAFLGSGEWHDLGWSWAQDESWFYKYDLDVDPSYDMGISRLGRTAVTDSDTIIPAANGVTLERISPSTGSLWGLVG